MKPWIFPASFFLVLVIGITVFSEGETTDSANAELFQDIKRMAMDAGLPWRETNKADIVVINQWATWCKPCIKEIPALNVLTEEFSDVPFFAVTKENAARLDSFLTRTPFMYSHWSGDRTTGMIQLLHSVPDTDEGQPGASVIQGKNAIPRHLIIHKRRGVLFAVTGYSEENIEKLKKAIAQYKGGTEFFNYNLNYEGDPDSSKTNGNN